MRKKVLIDAIMPRIRQGVLSATLLEPERAWFMSELARHLGVASSSLQRELASLTTAGLLKSHRQGRMVYFQADTECPVYADLHGLLSKTAGLVDVLRTLLEPLVPKIACAFVFGSVARRQEDSRSDVDLMVIGQAGLSDLAGPVRAAHERLAREVNPITYPPEEFADKVALSHYFVTRVLEQPKLFVIGTQHDLDRLAQRRVPDARKPG